MGAGLTLLRAWASAGTQVKPLDAEIDLGWLGGEQPAVEWENERMFTRDTLVNAIVTYLNDGVPISDLVADSSIVLPSTKLFQVSGGGSEGATRMNDDGYSIVDTDEATTYQLGTSMQAPGLVWATGMGYGGGPGFGTFRGRCSYFQFVPSGVSTTDRIIDFTLATPVEFTGVPDVSFIHGVVLRFSTDSEGYERHSLPLSCTFVPEDNGTYSSVTISGAAALATSTLLALTNIHNGIITVFYDPQHID